MTLDAAPCQTTMNKLLFRKLTRSCGETIGKREVISGSWTMEALFFQADMTRADVRYDEHGQVPV